MKRNYFGTTLTLLVITLIGAIAANAQTTTAQAQYRRALDFDGDGKADMTVLRNFQVSELTWFSRNSSNGTLRAAQFGAISDQAQPGDYDGDGKSDIAVVRRGSSTTPGAANWYILQSSNGTFRTLAFGTAGAPDRSVAADYDGDGKTDIAVARLIAGGFTWYIYQSSNNQVVSRTVNFEPGASFCQPMHAGDFDGDGKQDAGEICSMDNEAYLRWVIVRSSNGAVERYNWGKGSDYAQMGDFDGDGKTDCAVTRQTYINNNDTIYTWYIRRSSDGATQAQQFGGTSFTNYDDYNVPADYDGDGKTDIAVWRGGGSTNRAASYYILRSSTNSVQTVQWGGTPDRPLGIFAAIAYSE